MKLYYFPVAPNPTRVLVFVREKGIDIDTEFVDLRKGEQTSDEHLARNPQGSLPVLQLDNGEYLTESLPIMEYLEELYPDPVLIGTDALARARTREFERQVEVGILNPLARIVHATNSPLGLPARPEIAAAENARLLSAAPGIDARIGSSPFAIGDSPSVVDCTLFAGLLFGEAFGATIPDECTNIHRWYREFRKRPSTQL
jgi:glutathione S-transferase